MKKLKRAAVLSLLASSALLLAAPAASAKGDNGAIKFSAARDYPSANVTYNGTANPGVITHLFRNGKRDKHADLVLSNIVGGPVVLYGTGGGQFADRRVINNHDTDASATYVADFNADGVPDIVSGGYTTGRLTVMLGKRDGSFRVSGQYPLQGIWTQQFQVADLNHDGHLDITTAAYFGNHITILLGTGNGTFRAAPSPRGPTLAQAIVVADFNGDRTPDLAVTEAIPSLGKLTLGANTALDLLHGHVEILLGNGDGTFRPAATYPIGVLSENIRYADVNEDGKGDLVILNALVGNDASILMGRSGGRFAPERRMHVGGPDSLEPLGVRTVDGSEGLQLVDFNRDGHLDMVVTQMTSSTLVIFKGDGHGSFTFAGQQRVTGFPEDLMAGDLDGDGCPDLAVPGNVPPIGPSDVGVARVSILLNRSARCPGPPKSSGPKKPGDVNEAPIQSEPILQLSVLEIDQIELLQKLLQK